MNDRISNIVIANDKNIDTIFELNRQIILSDIYSFWTDKKWIKNEIKNKYYYLLIVEKIPVGSISVKFSKKYSMINCISINQESQNMGFGSKLISFACKKAKLYTNEIMVMTFSDFDNHNFYVKNGFKKVGSIHNYFGLPYYYMNKKLSR